MTADTIRLVSNTLYNEIGQLYEKQLQIKDSVNYLQSIVYTYNQRGWLSTSTCPPFALILDYNEGSPYKNYDGNISYLQKVSEFILMGWS